MTGAWVEKNEEVEDVGVAVSSDSEMHRGLEEPHLRKWPMYTRKVINVGYSCDLLVLDE
jgi:hypothetical protein